MADFEIMVAPNGARRQKSDHPALPITADEVAQTAARCQAAGASALHLHVRDEAGRHSLDAGRYQVAMAAVAEAAPGMSIQITTESAGIYAPDEQFACLTALQPLSASVSIREMAQDPGVASRAYAFCAEIGTKVQHILYGADCIEQLKAWYAAGVVPSQLRDAIFVLGAYSPPVPAMPKDLLPFLDTTADMELNWSLCAFGRHEQACLLAGLQAGGNLRIGFENNIETPDGDVLTDNAASVAALIKAVNPAGKSTIKG